MKIGLSFCVCSFLHHLNTLKMKKISSIATLYLSVPDRSEGSTTSQSNRRHSSHSLACVLCSRQKKLTQNSALPDAITLSEAPSQQRQQCCMEKLSTHSRCTDIQVTPPTTTAKSPTESPLFQREIPELENFSSNTSLNRKILSSAKALTAKEDFATVTAAQAQNLCNKELLSDDTKLNTTKIFHKNKERNDHNKDKEEGKKEMTCPHLTLCFLLWTSRSLLSSVTPSTSSKVIVLVAAVPLWSAHKASLSSFHKCHHSNSLRSAATRQSRVSPPKKAGTSCCVMR